MQEFGYIGYAIPTYTLSNSRISYKWCDKVLFLIIYPHGV